MRRLALLLLILPLAACGSRHAKPRVPVSPAHLLGANAHVLYPGGDWDVVASGSKALAAHLVGGVWRADRSGAVKLDILAPNGKATTTPQVAVEITANAPLLEEGLWVDGVELIEKGGGLNSHRITVYGAPEGKLKKGVHTAVAYARTDTHGNAVAWTFTVV